MIPNHIQNEVLRRLPDACDVTVELATSLGIDPTAEPLEPIDPFYYRQLGPEIDEASDPIYCDIPFELTLSVLGIAHIVECRARYAVVLDLVPERSVDDVFGDQLRFEVLDWIDGDARDQGTGNRSRVDVPRWLPIDLFPLIPQTLETKLDQQARSMAHAQFKQRSQKSRP